MTMTHLIRRLVPVTLTVALLSTGLVACKAENGERLAEGGPQLQAPSNAPDLTARRFIPGAEAAPTTGWVDLTETFQLGAAGQEADAAALGQTVLALATEKGQQIQGELQDAFDSTAAVAGQPVSTLMDIPADAAPSLYKVTAENNQNNATGLCGARPATHLVVWEDVNDLQGRMVLLVSTGAAPGQAGAVLCQVLTYQRQGG
ncbi:MAG: hypothetical protein ACOYKM_03990 [Caulobacterales bacterium]|jgi:hypothetical protein